ncbi:DUF11 domain-containing protein [bacterium]|nr:DUF11 domain-containing protein [bacterium]
MKKTIRKENSGLVLLLLISLIIFNTPILPSLAEDENSNGTTTEEISTQTGEVIEEGDNIINTGDANTVVEIENTVNSNTLNNEELISEESTSEEPTSTDEETATTTEETATVAATTTETTTTDTTGDGGITEEATTVEEASTTQVTSADGEATSSLSASSSSTTTSSGFEEEGCFDDNCPVNVVDDNEAVVENNVVEIGSTGNNQIGSSLDATTSATFSDNNLEIEELEEATTTTTTTTATATSTSATTSNEIATTTDDTTSTSEEIASTTEEVTTSTEEVASTTDSQIEGGEVGGDAVINTGNVNLVVGVFNTVNSNLIDSDFSQFLLNIFENLEGDIDLSDKIGSSTQESCSSTTNCFNFVNNNQGEIENNVLVEGVTGNNSANSRNGNAAIKTGNANAVLNIFNSLNSNIIGSNWTQLIINVFGDWMGDLVFPGKEEMEEFVNQNSSQCGGGCGNTNIVNSNEGQIENEVYVAANTGGNQANGSSTVIRTGNANVKTNNLNIVNSNLQDNNWLFIGINNFGKWEGNIFSLPPWLKMSEDSNGIRIYNVDSCDFNEATGTNSLNIVNDNSGFIKNSIIVNVSTGNNSANAGGGQATIETGDVNVLTNLVNVLNSNIINNNLLFGTINVFGNWQGDLAFGRPDLWIAESAVTSPNPAEPGGTITYTLNYFNNGNADATKVTIVDDFDERYLSIADPGDGIVKENPGEIQWNIGDVPAGGSGTVSYTVLIDPEIPYGTTYLTNQSEITSFEDDWNKEDNTDILSVEVYRARPPVIYYTPSSSYPPPKLELTKTNDVTDFVYTSSTVDYTILLKNNSGSHAYNVIVTDVLLNDLPEPIYTYSWNLGEVRAYEKITINYTVRIDLGVPPGFYTNIAQARGVDIFTNQVISNQASTTIEVRERGEEIPSEEVSGGEEISFGEEEEEEETGGVSLEDIEEELNEIEIKIEKIKEEIERKIKETSSKVSGGKIISHLPKILIPEASAQEEAPSVEREPLIVLGESLPESGNEGLERFLATIGRFFSDLSLENLLWIILVIAILYLIGLFLTRRRKKKISQRT